ncbi:MAG: hypothetical protein COA52_19715 [Hyphomicrobiales bacterium]|nr:MAG: hypothetical protein COA52_19715 [Hyphomicrobiales bacterium]
MRLQQIARAAALIAGSALAIISLSTASQAQVVNECDWVTNARNIVEPWEKNTRTFANGDVRLALIDVVEPAAGAFHILVLSPPYDELGTRQCRQISTQSSIGFSGINFSQLDAGYDPSVGLMFQLPVQIFDPNSGNFVGHRLLFTVNQATGAIGTQLRD